MEDPCRNRLLLSTGTSAPIPKDYQPLQEQFERLSQEFNPADISGESIFSEDDVADIFGYTSHGKSLLFLGYYNVSSIEYGLFRYGILDFVKRLGYDPLRITIDQANNGDRCRLFGMNEGEEHLLIEMVAEKRVVADALMLYIHWLTLRNPKATFSKNRPQLPGQEEPGLGLAKESSELMRLMAKRLSLRGVAFQPAWFHVAYAMRRKFAFADAEIQGRFEALKRDLSHIPLLEATLAIDEGRVLRNGEPYIWETGILVSLLDANAPDRQAIIDRMMEETTFTLLPKTQPTQANLSEENSHE